MLTRINSETVSFRRPFLLSGADGEQPAGCYLVETETEQLQSLSFPAYRRLSTVIRLAGTSGSAELARVLEIDPAELAQALARDAAEPEARP